MESRRPRKGTPDRDGMSRRHDGQGPQAPAAASPYSCLSESWCALAMAAMLVKRKSYFGMFSGAWVAP